MLFNSYIFILLFLPVTLIGYYRIGRWSREGAEFWLLAMSLWFYAYHNPWYLILIGSSILVNFFCSRRLNHACARGKKDGRLLFFAVFFNLALIFYFKYFNFFLENVNTVFRADFVTRKILLPLGISFFTFQQISYVVDSYEGKTAGYSLREYALFVTFFPQLVAGPIVLPQELIPQMREAVRKKWDAEYVSRGIMMFTLGLSKKVLLADRFGVAVDFIFPRASDTTSLNLMAGLLAYTFQIYFDFSGYSDMAVGLGQLFHFDLPINFNSPYQALSPADFWKRWHITLTRFLRTYIYFPLGGNRRGKLRTYLNTMVVFFVSGLWHGANNTFVLWGLLHGLGICLYRMIRKPYDLLPKWIRWGITFLYNCLLWIPFRAGSVEEAKVYVHRLFLHYGMYVSPDFAACFRLTGIRSALSALHLPLDDTRASLLSMAILFLLAFALILLPKNNYDRSYRTTKWTMAGTLLLLMVCILSLSRVSVFLYFNF